MATQQEIEAQFAKVDASFAAYDQADQKTQADKVKADDLHKQAADADAVEAADAADEGAKKSAFIQDLVDLQTMLGASPQVPSAQRGGGQPKKTR